MTLPGRTPERSIEGVPLPPWAARRRFTVDEYHRMGEAGILGVSGRTELIEGQVLEMSPVGSPHLGAVYALTRLFVKRAPEGVVVSVQSPIRLGPHNEPEPDLALLRARADGYRRPPQPTVEDALLLVEVSDATLRFDRTVKLPLYARHRVAEVWIVDVAGRVLETYRAGGPSGYGSVTIYQPGEVVAPLACPGLWIPVDEAV